MTRRTHVEQPARLLDDSPARPPPGSAAAPLPVPQPPPPLIGAEQHMSTTAPKPPTKRLLGTGLSGGITFAILTTCGLTALAYRIWRASDFGLIEALTSAGTGLLLIAAAAAGWTAHTRNLRARVETAEWEAAKARRAQRDREEEERSWWADDDSSETTAAFGTKVIPLNLRRPKAS